MAVSAIREDYYTGPAKDVVENFHGNQVVYTAWDAHTMFSFPAAFPLSPAMPFSALVAQVLPAAYSLHPEFARIDWEQVEWLLDDEPFVPDTGASLADNGIGHKSVLRLITPGLNGIANCGF
jgi:phenol hydroxylase P4 protein